MVLLTAHSAAEVSAGLICTCLPTIPAIVSRRRTSGNDRTPEIDPRALHLRTLTRKQPTGLSDQNPLDGVYLELGEGNSQDGGNQVFPAAVATDIEGGKPRGTQADIPGNLKAKEDEFTRGPGIMKTVVVELFHDVGR